MCQTLHLGLELHDLDIVGLLQRGDEITDLLHLQPQIRPQHNQIVQPIAQKTAISRNQRVAVALVKLREDPSQIARRIVHLHVLPIGDRGDGRAREQQIAVAQTAVHRARGERPQAVRLQNVRPAIGDLLRNMAGLAQIPDPGDQLSANLPRRIRRILRLLQEIRTQTVDGAQRRADGRAIIQRQQFQRTRLAGMMRRHKHRRVRGDGTLRIAVRKSHHAIDVKPKSRQIAVLRQHPRRADTPRKTPAPLLRVGGEHVVQRARRILHHGMVDTIGRVGGVDLLAGAHSRHHGSRHRGARQSSHHESVTIDHTANTNTYKGQSGDDLPANPREPSVYLPQWSL